MCQTLALATAQVALVAADTRYTFPDGVHDWGNKLRRVPGGWVAGTGPAAPMLLGLRAVESVGLYDLPVARSRALRAMEEARVAAGMESLGLLYLFASRLQGSAPSIHTIERPHGGEDFPAQPGIWQRLVSWAPGLTREQKAAGESILEVIDPLSGSARTVPAILRAVGAAFVHGHRYGRGVSAEVEVGYDALTEEGPAFGYLRCPAAWLARAGDEEIASAVGLPPVIPPFPFAECESRNFILSPA